MHKADIQYISDNTNHIFTLTIPNLMWVPVMSR